MKKVLIFILCCLMCLSLFSCEENNIFKIDETTSANVSSEKNSVSQNNHATENSSSQSPAPTKRKLAMQAYEAVTKNEIKLHYPLYDSSNTKELYFKEIFYVGKDHSPVQAVIDMDKDGVEEMVLKNNSTGKIVLLHYENDIVYGFDFNTNTMEFYSDGSFSWSYYSSKFGNEYGISRISFVNGKLKFQELCRTEEYSKFYLNGIQVTAEEYQKYCENNIQTQIEFTPFNIFLLSKEEAIAIASNHWGIKDGEFDAKTGYRYKLTAYIEDDCYRVCLYWFEANSYYSHLDCVFVNGDTGETSVPEYPEGKG